MSAVIILQELFCALLRQRGIAQRKEIARSISKYVGAKPSRSTESLGGDLGTLLGSAVPAACSIDGWRDIPSRSSSESLVALGPFSDFPELLSRASYFKEDMSVRDHFPRPLDREYSLLTPFLRSGAAERLRTAAGKLEPTCLAIVIYDAYRPKSVQRLLFEHFQEYLRRAHPEWSVALLESETQKYVSRPAPDSELGLSHVSPHASGGAIDLTLARLHDPAAVLLEAFERIEAWRSHFQPFRSVLLAAGLGEECLNEYFRQSIRHAYASLLEMGTDFDHFGPEAATNFWENKGGVEVVANRRLLYNLMRENGFRNYPEEWWHYSIGDGMAARQSGEAESLYHEAVFSEANLQFEKMRRLVWTRLPQVRLGECTKSA